MRALTCSVIPDPVSVTDRVAYLPGTRSGNLAEFLELKAAAPTCRVILPPSGMASPAFEIMATMDCCSSSGSARTHTGSRIGAMVNSIPEPSRGATNRSVSERIDLRSMACGKSICPRLSDTSCRVSCVAVFTAVWMAATRGIPPLLAGRSVSNSSE